MPPRPEVNQTFSDDEIDALLPYGEVREHAAGDILTANGTAAADCLVTLSGETHIFVQRTDGETRVGYMERGQFAGDITILTGQAALAQTTMGVAGKVLHIPHESFKRLLIENSRLSDIFIRTLTARREFGRTEGQTGIIVIGAARERETFAIRVLLDRHGIPHVMVDPEVDELAQRLIETHALTPEDLPAVIRGGQQAVLKNPEPAALSKDLGLDLLPDGTRADVIVVGAGPAGLAASVYAASEGLSVLTLDADGPGGQAGTSSKIENYLGFPTGISGRDLAENAAIQAQKFGTRIAAPARASGLTAEGTDYCIALTDGRKLLARSVVIATGAQYRRLPIDNIEHFEGRGIHYGATPMEAQLCRDEEVAVVGAGNSAGQGAVFLAQTAKTVYVVYRRDDIRETMSEYLVRRLEETPNIVLMPATQISALHAADDGKSLGRVTWKNERTGKEDICDARYVFLFIGAAPFTQWLPDVMSCDGKGFLKTGTDIQNIDLVKARWPLERMPTKYETSWPGVYAVGDVRTGSVKRVASAVGEGSVVVSDIHAALAERDATAP